MQQKNMLTQQDIKLISAMIKNTVNDSMVSFAGTVSKIIEPLAADIKEIRKDVNKLKIDVNELRVDVNELRVDVNKLKIDVAVLKTDVAALKIMTGDIKADLHFFKEDTLEFKKYMYKDQHEQNTRIMRLEDKKLGSE